MGVTYAEGEYIGRYIPQYGVGGERKGGREESEEKRGERERGGGGREDRLKRVSHITLFHFYQYIIY